MLILLILESVSVLFWLFFFQFHERVEENDQEDIVVFILDCQKEVQQQDGSIRNEFTQL